MFFCFGYNYTTIGPLVDDDTVVLIEISMVSLSMFISFMYLLYSFLFLFREQEFGSVCTSL